MADTGDVPLVDFFWQGEALYSCYALAIPPVGAFVVLPCLTSERLGRIETPTSWRVHAVEYFYPFVPGQGELCPEITVHLRRLHPHEWGNRHEPSGYAYLEPGAPRGGEALAP